MMYLIVHVIIFISIMSDIIFFFLGKEISKRKESI
jgi:hypothetical protein